LVDNDHVIFREANLMYLSFGRF